MANMIPSVPRDDTDKKSGEKRLFEILQEYLGPDYYVVHSHEFVTKEKIYDEFGINLREIDFLIFHQKYGFLVVEAKNTPDLLFEDGNYFYYNDGKKIIMKHDGPYRQGRTAMFELMNSFFECGLFSDDIYNELRKNKSIFKSCVWFPQISLESFNSKALPKEASIDITITKIEEPLLGDSVKGIGKKIESIFKMGYTKDVFNDYEFKRVLNHFICPKFEIISSPLENAEQCFLELHKEQALVLNYLEEQKTAAIAGVAGSGKTLLAIEKARRTINKGKVLFLCYNKYLCDYLIKKYSSEFGKMVDFYTIDSFACYCTKSSEANYCDLAKCLDKMNYDAFPYYSIIVDEGQDFGQKDIEDNLILLSLKDLVYDENKDNTGEFYIFYDKNQMVQASMLAEVIKECDCKLTLYKNCRNTFNIARTSLKSFNKIPKMHKKNLSGNEIEMTFCDSDNFISRLDSIIEKLTYDDQCHSKIVYDYKDIVILTSGSVEKSLIRNYVVNESDNFYYKYNGNNKNKILVTTSRKFKGLESPAVILIDVSSKYMRKSNTSEDEFTTNEKNVYYVATSRAKFDLAIIFNMSTDEIKSFVNSGSDKLERNKKMLIKSLDGVIFTDINGFELL
ncbi:MAG: NERD domain-containing protein [Acholeplasmatales bacterium]|nr:NERD domain-containing protein [Acholeplasmatales bacterium]